MGRGGLLAYLFAIVLCIITLAVHKSLSTEANLDYSSSNQADLKYL